MVSQNQEQLQRILSAAFISLTVFVHLNQAVHYNGFKVYQLSPDTSEKIAVLKSLNGATGYDFWQEPRGNTSKLMVAPEQQEEFEKLMASAGIRTVIAVDDVGTKVRKDVKARKEHLEKTAGGRRGNFRPDWRSFSFDRYLRYNEMRQFSEEMISGNSKAELFVFGKTSEGRDMFAVKLSTSDKNPVILIDGGIHAREWAAPMSVLYILKNLVNDENLLRHVTFYIVPLVNPDGYEYTHVEERFWRKTMSKQPFTDCLGVDANRNFDSHWNEFGAESDPCSPIYSGPSAFSEPETRALRDLMITVKPVMYLTIHTYGGLILHPWGFTSELPQNGDNLISLAKKAAAAIEKKFNTNYRVGSATNMLCRLNDYGTNPASGGSDDWSMEKGGATFAFCIELEDYGALFDLPPEKLNEIVQHADTVMRVFAKHVEENCSS